MERIYRVTQGGETFYAVASENELRRASGDPFGGLTPGAVIAGGLSSVTVLAPVRPSKIVCVGLNYKDHAGEVGKALPAEPLLFIKPASAVIGPGEAIRRPPGSDVSITKRSSASSSAAARIACRQRARGTTFSG